MTDLIVCAYQVFGGSKGRRLIPSEDGGGILGTEGEELVRLRLFFSFLFFFLFLSLLVSSCGSIVFRFVQRKKGNELNGTSGNGRGNKPSDFDGRTGRKRGIGERMDG